MRLIPRLVGIAALAAFVIPPSTLIGPMSPAIAQTQSKAAKTYSLQRFTFQAPSHWVRASSDSDRITLFNQKPPQRGGGLAPQNMMRLNASISPESLQAATQPSANSRRSSADQILKTERRMINGIGVVIQYSTNENSDFDQAVTAYVPYSDRETAVLSIFYAPSNPNADRWIQQIHNSIKIR